jgi:hypoxanthine-guanine phosphoribosyltransferase
MCVSGLSALVVEDVVDDGEVIRIIDRIGPLSVLRQRRRFRKDTVLCKANEMVGS